MAIVKMKRLSLIAQAEDKIRIIAALTQAACVEIRRDQEAEEALQNLRRERIAASRETTDGAVEKGAASEHLPAAGLTAFDGLRTELFYRDLLGEERFPDFNRMSRETYRGLQNEAQKRIARLDEYILTGQKLSPDKKPMFAVRREITADEFLAIADRQGELLRDVQELEANRQSLQQLRSERSALYARMNLFRVWDQVELPAHMSSEGGGFRYYAGSLRNSKNGPCDFLAALDEAFEGAYAADRIAETEQGTAMLIAARTERADEMEQFLRRWSFTNLPEIPAGLGHSYADAVRQLQEQAAQLDEREAELDWRAGEIAAGYRDWQVLRDFYAVAVDKLEAMQKLLDSGRLFALRAYVPADRADELKTTLGRDYACAVEVIEPAEDEKVPVALRNNKLFRPYEAIIEMFSLPLPGRDIDPVPFMAPFYALLFGMMLSDVGYGLTLAILCGYMVFRKGVEGTMRKMCLILMQGGICGILFGFLFGGFFGNAVTAVSGGKVNFPVLWFDPMDKPLQLMVVSILFGCIHLFVGMAINMYLLTRAGQALAGFVQTVPWYLIIVGFGLTVINVGWAKWMILAGAVMILLLSAGGERNPIKRLFSGLGALYGVTGYLSDLLSYTRILALTLATSVIAMVVNILSTMAGLSVFGVILFVLIMPFGHLLNLALSGLSCYVHTTRLQYVEFFSKFYGGGGEAFMPLQYRTKYVCIRTADAA